MSKPANSRLPFTGCRIVVTGSSSGIGRAIAVRLAQLGASKIAIHYCRNRKGAEKTASELESLEAEALLLQADLAHDEQVDSLADQAFERLGVIDAWVNNAGADVLTGESANWEFDQKLRHLFNVDVIGTARLARNVGWRMRQQYSETLPAIAMIGWDQAPHGMEGEAGQMFGPVKAAVMAFSKSLAQTLAPDVRVNTIAPGWIRTSWGQSTSEYWNERATHQSLMNRWGTAEDVASAVAFACDPSNSFLTGQSINVNGGWNRRFTKPD